MDLTQQKCIACEGNEVVPFDRIEAEVLLKQVPGWELSPDAKAINKKYLFKNFKEALVFVNTVGDIAESEGHHPDIHLTDYKHVEVNLSTHAIDGLSQNDFIVAAKIDEK
jgi:4a-hydroxytetrahydrobiopterin dehydratase